MQHRGAFSAPLALEEAPTAFSSRVSDARVDALPYADVLPDGWRDRAEAAVRDEMRRSPASLAEYAAALPPLPGITFKARRAARALSRRAASRARRRTAR